MFRRRPPTPEPARAPGAAAEGRARPPVIAVWGPTGSPGRSTVAAALAEACARLGHQDTLLVDADLCRGTLAQHLGARPGGALASACLIRPPDGQPCAPGHLQRPYPGGPWLLPGLTVPAQGLDVDPDRLAALLRALANVYRPLILDCGPFLPPDPRGLGHLAALRLADAVLVVCRADAVGLQDCLLQAGPLIAEVGLAACHGVILTHTDPERAPRDDALLSATLGLRVVCQTPHDHAIMAALRARRPLTRHSPTTPAAVALTRLATRLVGAP